MITFSFLFQNLIFIYYTILYPAMQPILKRESGTHFYFKGKSVKKTANST